MSRGSKALVVLAAVVVLGTWLKAQAPAQPDVLPALLDEVKGLRAAMEQMASAGPRIQLFTSRLQLQETRINNMIRRLDTVRDSREAAERDLAHVEEQQRQGEQALAAGTGPVPREELVDMIAQAKRAVADRKTRVSRLTTEENQLAADIATEQARWSDINARLDELERSLTKR